MLDAFAHCSGFGLLCISAALFIRAACLPITDGPIVQVLLFNLGCLSLIAGLAVIGITLAVSGVMS